MINLFIIEDDKTTRESLVEYIKFYPQINLVAALRSAEEGLLYLRRPTNDKPDILILDIGLPGMTGIESIPAIRKCCPDLDIMMFTTYEEEDKIFKALRSGACSYISKRTPLDIIMDSIQTVYDGGSYMSPVIARKIAESYHKKDKVSYNLTDRQMQIVKGLVDGLSYQRIADQLNISIGTVRTHIKNIYKSMEVNSSLELVNKFHSGEV